MGKLSPEEFCSKYLPTSWCEQDLQMLIARSLNAKLLNLYHVKLEEKVYTPTTTRRIDISTPIAIYEVKCWLDYENIYHAVGQTEIYSKLGSKIFGLIPKQRIIIGLAPTDFNDYKSAAKLKKDFSSLRGTKVIFINEDSSWHTSNKNGATSKYLVATVVFLLLIITLLLGVIFFSFF